MKTIRIETPEPKTRPRSSGAVIFSGLAFVCLSAGVFSPLLGLVFIIVHSVIVADQGFGELGTGLMVVSIPLLLAGSHFLDVWDKYRKKSDCANLPDQ